MAPPGQVVDKLMERADSEIAESVPSGIVREGVETLKEELDRSECSTIHKEVAAEIASLDRRVTPLETEGASRRRAPRLSAARKAA